MKYSKFYKNPYTKIRTTISIEKLNALIDKNKTKKIVKICEDNYLKQIDELVRDVISLPIKRFIHVAGPTSSGKTTTAGNIKKLLEKRGYKATVLSLDDFLITLKDRKLLPNGEQDFESFDTIDSVEFQKVLNDLLYKGQAMVPEYDFEKSERKAKKRKVVASEDEYFIIEGLHALNPNLVGHLHEHVYKVYICPYKDYYYKHKLVLTAKELRLMRRSIREHFKRDLSIDKILSMWEQITDSEYIYIKPYKFMCDYFINSAIDYEACLYATYLKPLLEEVKEEESTWPLFAALDKFAKLDKNVIPENSLLWEFLNKD